MSITARAAASSASTAALGWEGRQLARGDTRAYAARLLTLLAPLMVELRPEHLEDLDQAIALLNECEEGSEGAHWVNVGWALLDLEPLSEVGTLLMSEEIEV